MPRRVRARPDERGIPVEDGVHERRRPTCPFVDPLFDRGDLRRRERTGRQHLDTELVTDQTLIQRAAVGIARADYRNGAAAERVLSPIQTQPVLLLGGAVAAIALLPKDRLDVADEVDSGGLLRAELGPQTAPANAEARPRRRDASTWLLREGTEYMTGGAPLQWVQAERSAGTNVANVRAAAPRQCARARLHVAPAPAKVGERHESTITCAACGEGVLR